MTAFIFSSFVTLVSAIVYLCWIRSDIPEEESFNVIDGFLRKHVATRITHALKRIPWVNNRRNRVRGVLFQLVQALADMQLVTGTAMLAAGIIKLHRGNISVYHFNMVTSLAWLSSNVQLMSILSIRTELLGSLKKHRRQKYMAAGSWSVSSDIKLRALLMLVMAALLLYSCWIAGWEDWEDQYVCPANSALGKPHGGRPLNWLIVNFVLVISGYLTHVTIVLFPQAHIWWLDNIRHHVVDDRAKPQIVDADRVELRYITEDRIRPSGSVKGWRKWTRWVWFFFASETLHVLMDGFVWFILGIVWIAGDLEYMTEAAPDVRQKENDIEGFGQLVPLFLVGLPFLQVLTSYCGK